MRRAAALLSLVVVAWLGSAATATATVRTTATATARTTARTADAAPTGNLLVLLQPDQTQAATGALVLDALRGLGARPAGHSVAQIGLITVRPPRGVAEASFEREVDGIPAVASVQPELRYTPRAVPNDPALSVNMPGTSVPWQWYLGREDFFRAWSLVKGRGALVGVIDTGVDGTHPDFTGKIAAAVNQQAPSDSTGPADTDQVGHGTHVASLACAGTNNGIGLAGAGYDCRMVIEKTDFTDSSIAAAIVDATKRHVEALNMSFGPSGGGSQPAPRPEVRALRYAAAHKVVLVAAASDSPSTEQGDPANVLQPAGTGPNLAKGIGLDVTAADYGGQRATFAGSGSEISLAAYGVFRGGQNVFSPCGGTPFGIFGAFPANPSQMEAFPPTACRVDFQGDRRYATIAGTSMAAPQVAATGAMMRVLNPYATLQDILRAIKRTARRPGGHGWSPDLGWGILNAGAALQAIRRVDRLAPVSTLTVPKATRGRTVTLRWSGHDRRRRELIPSGLAYFKLYAQTGRSRPRLIARTRRNSWRFTGLAGHRYVFWLVAVDRAGNRQPYPAHHSTLVAGAVALAGAQAAHARVG